jgi:hypothetical protein
MAAHSQLSSDYHFPDLVSESDNGIYAWEGEGAYLAKYRTIPWRYVAAYQNADWYLGTILCIDTASDSTIRGQGSDGFAISRTEIANWKISNGLMIDPNGYQFKRISPKQSGEKTDIIMPVITAYWSAICMGAIVDPGTSIKLSKTGIVYDDEEFNVLWENTGYLANEYTILRHLNRMRMPDKHILVKYSDHELIFYEAVNQMKSYIPGNIIGKARVK